MKKKNGRNSNYGSTPPQGLMLKFGTLSSTALILCIQGDFSGKGSLVQGLWLGFDNLAQTRVIWEEGTSVHQTGLWICL